MEIQFHLDESVATAVARGLRQRGISVSTSAESGLLGALDEDQLAFALGEQRVIVTHDDDFLRLANAGKSHAGVAYCHQHHRTIGQIVLALVSLWRAHTAEEVSGIVRFL